MAATKAIARVFAEDTRIIFNPDGSYVWRLANGEGPLQRAEPSRTAAIPDRRERREAVRARHGAPASSRFTHRSTSRSKTTSCISRIRGRPVISRDFLALISGRDITRGCAPRSPAPGDLTRACRAVRAPPLLHRSGRPRQGGHDVHLWQPDGRHHLGHRAALRHQARLRQTLRIPAARRAFR